MDALLCVPSLNVVLPIMKPTYISVGILETMWIWNDFLLPYLVLNLNKYKTISIAIQYMKGSYGRVDMGAIMAALILGGDPGDHFLPVLSEAYYQRRGCRSGEGLTGCQCGK